MNPIKIKFANSEDLFQELTNFVKLPKQQWIEKIDNLCIKKIINSNQNLLISNTDEALERLTAIKKRLKKFPSEKNEKQTETLKIIHESIERLANLSEDEDVNESVDISSFNKELEIIRKLPKDQWHEKINNLTIRNFINKNINILIDNNGKTLAKLSQIQSRLGKEPSTDAEAQEKVQKAVTRAIDLVSCASDEEDDLESSSISVTSSSTLLQSSTSVSSNPILSTSNMLTDSDHSAASKPKPSLKKILLNEPQCPKLPLKGSPVDAVNQAIKAQLEYVNLISYEEWNQFEELDDQTLARLFNENKAMKCLWIMGCTSLTTLPVNNQGYALQALYCNHCENLKVIPYECFPNLEILECEGSQNLSLLPPPNEKLRVLNINYCIQFDVNLFELFERYPNLIRGEQRIGGNSDHPELQTASEKAMTQEIWDYFLNYDTRNPNNKDDYNTTIANLQEGVAKIKQKWQNQLNLHSNKQEKEDLKLQFQKTYKRTCGYSQRREEDLQAEAEGKPKYWRKMKFVATILDTIEPDVLKTYTAVFKNTNEESLYDAIIKLYKQNNPDKPVLI